MSLSVAGIAARPSGRTFPGFAVSNEESGNAWVAMGFARYPTGRGASTGRPTQDFILGYFRFLPTGGQKRQQKDLLLR
jgi:hypothetical protein